MKTLVLGGTGFIGKNLVKNLKNQDVFIGNSTLDISKESLVKQLMEDLRPDLIYHLAGIPNSKPSDPDQNRILDVNIKGTHNVLRFMKPKSRIIFASSIVVYGNCDNRYPTAMEPVNCTSVYASTKVACEELIKTYAELNNIEYMICRLGATVGPNLTHGLVHVILEKLKTKKDYIELLGNEPGTIKPFTYITDVVKSMINLSKIKFIKHDPYCNIFNVCNGNPISVKEVADIIMEELNIHKKIKWKGWAANWKGDNRYLNAVSPRMKIINNNQQFLDSQFAIRKTIHDIR